MWAGMEMIEMMEDDDLTKEEREELENLKKKF